MALEAAVPTRCGLVALVGRPNVGKSTLLNHLIGQKVSITSRKPQTTRQRLLGIKTIDRDQIVFVDTPGYHRGYDKAINHYMARTISGVLADVDVIVFVIDRLHFLEEDLALLTEVRKARVPILLVINKIDELPDREAILPFIAALGEDAASFADIVPVSALKEQFTAELERCIVRHLPQNPWYFPEDQLTDKSARYLAAEYVREKITRQMGDELPYEVAVAIEEYQVEGNLHRVGAVIYVEKESQKRMLIGENGSRLKLIGSEARKDMERLFDCKVMLRLWVKVKRGWSDDERALKSLGYD
ncbi:MAG: GTPase Era [Pseudomonadales bacterium]|nr:GTPase Era [Pseudomonadales bacterium]